MRKIRLTDREDVQEFERIVLRDSLFEILDNSRYSGMSFIDEVVDMLTAEAVYSGCRTTDALFNDLGRSGCASGMIHGLISLADLKDFYCSYMWDIDLSLSELEQELGSGPLFSRDDDRLYASKVYFLVDDIGGNVIADEIGQVFGRKMTDALKDVSPASWEEVRNHALFEESKDALEDMISLVEEQKQEKKRAGMRL